MIEVPCISLWQPWASLLFVREEEWRKFHETRSFAFPTRLFGEPVAIHAAKRGMTDGHISRGLHELCVRAFGPLYRSALPRGAVIGTVVINGWVRTQYCDPVSDADYLAGDWSRDRYAWRIEEARPIEPIPQRGSQCWFRVELPAETAHAG